MPINVITISGNLGKDAVVRVTSNGKHISQFSIPAKSGFGDNEKTSWLQCKMFGSMAEKLSQSLVKGAKVTVTGEYITEEWEKNDGTKVYTPTILVRDIDLPPRGTPGNDQLRQNKPARQQMQEPPMDLDDDSIPF